MNYKYEYGMTQAKSRVYHIMRQEESFPAAICGLAIWAIWGKLVTNRKPRNRTLCLKCKKAKEVKNETI